MSTLDQTYISVFQRFRETKKPYRIQLGVMVERIRTGSRSYDRVQKVRSLPKGEEQSTEKKELACFCVSGEFMERIDEGMVSHSGAVCLDFDGVTNPEDFRDSFRENAHVYAAFTSPSGQGVKVIFRVPASKSQHRGHYTALLKEYPEADPTCINESRVCFESYDPNIYHNPNPDEYTAYVAPEEKPKPVHTPSGQVRTNYALLNQCASMIRNAQSGSRNKTLLDASILAGGFVAAGYVDESVATALLEEEAKSLFGAEYPDERHTIYNGLKMGKLRPLYEIKNNVVIDDGKITGEKISTPPPVTESTHDIVFLPDVWDLMLDQFDNGKPRGTTTHLPGFDEYWTWKAAETTIFSGRPGSGKSELVFHLMLLKAVFDDWRFAVWGPENHPASEFYDTLIHGLVGKSVDKTYRNVMTRRQYEEAAKFIMNRFYYVDIKTQKTQKRIEANFRYAVEKFGCQAVLKDPYNRIQWEKSYDREDKHISDFMDAAQDFSRVHQIVDLLVVHPAGSKLRKKDNGEYPPVDYNDLSGGGMWSNKTDNYISVYRPFHQRNPRDPTVDIITGKIKRTRLVGSLGTHTVTFDPSTNRYYVDGKNPLESEQNPYDALSREKKFTSQNSAPIQSDSTPKADYSNNFPSNASSFYVPPVETENQDDPCPF